jgi:hypothetical protein
MIRMRRAVPAALLVLALSGCAPGVRTAMFRPAFPPTEEVDVYRTKMPERPYIEIAEIKTDARGDWLGRLKGEAASMGADAIIVLGHELDRTYYPHSPFGTFGLGLGIGRGVHPFGTFAFGYPVSVDVDIVAVAIRFEEEPDDRAADRDLEQGRDRSPESYPPRYR